MKPSDKTKINRFLKQLQNQKLPVLDRSIRKLNDNLAKVNTNFDIISKIINLDPMCIANFLACANQYKEKVAPEIDEELQSPKHASMMLGLDNIGTCVNRLKPISKYDNRDVAAKIEQLAYRSLHTAYQAEAIARLLGDKRHQDVFVSALFSSLPELLIWTVSPKKAQQYETLIFEENQLAEDAQIQIFDFYFRDLLLELSFRWHFPGLFVESIKRDVIDDASKSLISFKLADKLCRLVDFGWYYQEVEDFYDYASIITHFDKKRLSRMFHQISVLVANETLNIYQYHFPAQNLLMIQQQKLPYYPVIIFEDETIEEPVVETAKVKRNNVEAVRPETNNLNINIESAANIPTLIQLTVNALYNIEGVEHMFLLMMDNKHENLHVRIEKTKLNKSLLNHIIPIKSEQNIFSKLMEKPQMIYFTEDLLSKTISLMTNSVTDIIPFKAFSATSFYHKAKPIGAFCITSGQGITEKMNKQFRSIMLKFDQHLTRIS
ncbi:MAG: HDOD domain-containing protein [Gammaproteobacteria bacterium]|nr:HDOD domain-containing protein [Gammaproteobacteria bacterium]